MVTQEIFEDSWFQLRRNALTDLKNWHSEEPIVIFLHKPRVKLRFNGLTLLRDFPKIFEFLGSEYIVAGNIVWKIDDFVHELEDNFRKSMVRWRLESKEDDLNGVRWQESWFLKRLLIDTNQELHIHLQVLIFCNGLVAFSDYLVAKHRNIHQLSERRN